MTVYTTVFLEPSCSKHVEDIKIKGLKYQFTKCAFRWFMSCNKYFLYVYVNNYFNVNLLLIS